MKRIWWLMLCLFFTIMVGCSNSVSKNEQIDDPKQVRGYFEGLIKSVDENDKKSFLKYQNQKNKLFYKEQERWMEEVIYKKSLGDTISIDIKNCTIENASSGKIELVVKIKKAWVDKTVENPIIYSIKKINGKWKLNDVPFKEIGNEKVAVYYSEGQKEIAQTYLQDATKIVRFYESQFDWKHEAIIIKLYSNIESISASVPFPVLSGWNEYGESLKVHADPAAIYMPVVLVHELTHKMVSDITNDNAPPYIQEGIAQVFESSVYIGTDGVVKMDISNTSTMVASYNDNKFISFEEIKNLDYHKGLKDIYKYGFLVTNYFVQSKGLDKFLETCRQLDIIPYLDKRTEHKMKEVNKNSEDLFSRVYGTPEEITKNYKKFYQQ